MGAVVQTHLVNLAVGPRPHAAVARVGAGAFNLSQLWAMALLCIAACLASPALAQDDPPGRVGRIGTVQGEVWVYETEQSEWVPAQRNRPFTEADRLSTGADGRVELSIGSTSMLLGASAELEALQLDDEHITLQLHRGQFALNLRSSEVAAETKVLTGEGRFAFQRGGLYRIDRRDDTSAASVWRGDMSFQHEDFLLPLHTGDGAEFWLDGAGRTARSRMLPPLNDAFAAAVRQLDEAGQRSVAARYVSPEMTGVEELDQHGRWEEHPDHGSLWVPTVVAAGWAPYAHGHWTWLRPWGWTWVDDAPWGFAPFHYGRWLWWRGRWGWAPGPRMARPVYAPALVAWVGGTPAPAVVRGRGRLVPGVGWVPLAPREAYRPGYRASPGYVDRVNVGRGHGHWAGGGRRPFDEPPSVGNRYVPGAVTLPGQSAGDRVYRDRGSRPFDEQARPPADVSRRTGREQVSPRVVQPIEVPSRAPLPVPVPSAGDNRAGAAPGDRKPFWPGTTSPADTNRSGPDATGRGRGAGHERGRQGGNDSFSAAQTQMPNPGPRAMPVVPAVPVSPAATPRPAAPISAPPMPAAPPPPVVVPRAAAPPPIAPTAPTEARRPFVPPTAVPPAAQPRNADDASAGRPTMRAPQSRGRMAER